MTSTFSVKPILFTLLILYVLSVVINNPRDTTDDPNGSRSGMILYTDHLTGLQYLGNPWGGITPRLNVDGSQYRLK